MKVLLSSVGGGRIVSADVLKGIGIILVVLGHTTRNDELSRWIYHFHMPLFFFLSGVFFSPSIQGLVKRVRQILIPYLIFGVLSFIYWRFAEMRFRPLPENFDANMHFFDLFWQTEQFRFNVPLWFLPCLLIVQSVGAVLFCFIKNQKVLLATIVLWVLIANGINVSSNAMWVNETFYAFPFFALGYVIGKERYMKMEAGLSRKHDWLYSILAVMGLLTVWFLSARNDMMSSSYPNGYGAFFLVALICIMCLFALFVKIRSRRIISILTWLGVNSLIIMCLHEPLKRIIIVVFSKLLGMETEAVRESIVWSILMSCLIIVILVPVCMFMNRKCKWVLGKS